MTHPWLALLLIIALTGVAPASENDRDARREQLNQLIERFDRDGDGRLSPDEREQLRRFLEELRSRSGQEEIPQTVFPGKTDLYKLEDGPHDTHTVVSYPLRDEKRRKDIPLRLTFPKQAGEYPLVIFCHGALGSKDGSEPLASYWASHGYVVIRPTFGDSIAMMSEEDKRKVRSLVDLVNSPRTTGHWDDRPRDVSHLLDSLDTLEREVPGLAGKIDREKIAVAGHSFGAHTTMLISGLTVINPITKQTATFRDERVKASVAISPQGPTKSITEASYKTMAGPMLMITGDNDGTPMRGREEKKGEWRRLAFDYAPPGDKYLLWIKDAHHSFGGIGGNNRWHGAGPRSIDQVYYVKSTCLAFFDAYLKQDKPAKTYLNADHLARETQDNATLTAKHEDPGERTPVE